MVMIREYSLPGGQNSSAQRDLEGFSTAFKERFSKFISEYRYRGDPKVMFCCLKAQGDILMELRAIQNAILSYKELVTYHFIIVISALEKLLRGEEPAR